MLLAGAGRGVKRAGFEWALPFKAALAKATTEQRLLLLKPIAFGTEKSGGG